MLAISGSRQKDVASLAADPIRIGANDKASNNTSPGNH